MTKQLFATTLCLSLARLRRPVLAAAVLLMPGAALAQALGAQTPGAQTPVAQTAGVQTIAAPDPARLAAAERLLDTLMPPALREEMVQGMVAPMLTNVQQGVMQNAKFSRLIGNNAKVRAAFETFMQAQNARTLDLLRRSMPGMMTAMARAYARRFDVAQLQEVERFFRTPTGMAYMRASATIMSDPDIAAFQRDMMGEAMQHVQVDAVALAKEVAALQQNEKK